MVVAAGAWDVAVAGGVTGGGVVMGVVGVVGDGAREIIRARVVRIMKVCDISQPFSVIPRISKAMLICENSGPSPTFQRRFTSASFTTKACRVPRRREAVF